MPTIEIGKFYILKNSEDINDVVKVLGFKGSHVEFEYMIKSEFITKWWGESRDLSKEMFNLIYKEHTTTNLLFTGV